MRRRAPVAEWLSHWLPTPRNASSSPSPAATFLSAAPNALSVLLQTKFSIKMNEVGNVLLNFGDLTSTETPQDLWGHREHSLTRRWSLFAPLR